MLVKDTRQLGKALKKTRKSKGYTQSYISEFTGLSASFISNLENGKPTAEIGKVIEYASILGIDIEVNPRG